MGHTAKRKFNSALWVVPWSLGVALCVAAQTRLHHEPSAQPDLAAAWPQGLARYPHSTTASTIVLLCHPRCPCTTASLESLQTLLAHAPAGTLSYVILTVPAGAPDDWLLAPNCTLARSIPGVVTITDPQGLIAKQFGALSSGQAAVYSPVGLLRFQGGLTPSRGQTGGLATMTQALAALHDPASPQATQHLYGCKLVRPQEVPCPPPR